MIVELKIDQEVIKLPDEHIPCIGDAVSIFEGLKIATITNRFFTYEGGELVSIILAGTFIKL